MPVGVPVPVGVDGRLDLQAMAAAVTPRTKVVLVCTPNNPTGPAVHADELAAFLDGRARATSWSCWTRPTSSSSATRRPPTGSRCSRDHPNVVLLRTFSKAYGLAGLRVGYAVARPRLAAGIRVASTPFGVSHIGQLAALASLRAEDELMARVDQIVAERTRMLAGLRTQGWTVPDSDANFVWLAARRPGVGVRRARGRSGVLVRPFAGDGVRVSVGEPEATDLLLEVTADWLNR